MAATYIFNPSGTYLRIGVVSVMLILMIAYSAYVLPYYVQGVNMLVHDRVNSSLSTIALTIVLFAAVCTVYGRAVDHTGVRHAGGAAAGRRVAGYCAVHRHCAQLGGRSRACLYDRWQIQKKPKLFCVSPPDLACHTDPRYYQLCVVPWRKFLNDQVKQAPLYRFAWEAEIACRYLQQAERTADGLTSAQVHFAEWLYSSAIDSRRFSKSTVLPPTFALFIASYMGDKMHAVAIARSAYKDDPYMDSRYVIYMLERQSDSSSQSMMTETEYDSHYDLARRSHARCISEMQNFWRLLLKSNVSVSALPQIARKIEAAEARTLREYEICLEAKTNQVGLMREYADFLTVVRNDPDAAAVLTERIKLIEQRRRRFRDIDSETSLPKCDRSSAGMMVRCLTQHKTY
jgi:hypothetical protein